MRKIIIRIVLILFFSQMSLQITSQETKTDINVAVNFELPPFQFLNEDGMMDGLHIDIMNEIGLNENLNIKYVKFNTKSEALEALENGKVDIILGTLQNESSNFALKSTNEISSSSLSMIVNNSNISQVFEEKLERYTLAFELGTISLSQISQLNVMNTLVMGNQKQLYDALLENEVHAIIGVKDSILYLLKNDDISKSYTIVNNYIGTVNYSILTRRNDRVLYNSLNRGINQLRMSKTYEKFLNKWIANIELEAAQARSKKIIYYTIIFISLAFIVVCIIAYINYHLKKIVEEKTYEIRNRMQQLEDEGILRDCLIEYSPSGILLLEKDGTILVMNSAARTTFGIEDYDKTQKINVCNIKVLEKLWNQIMTRNFETMKQPSIIKINDGDINNRIFRYSFHNINIEENKVLMVEDITSEENDKQAMFELRKNKSLNRVIAGMAHEIKNPLMSINTFASLISQQGNDAEFQKLFAKHVPKEIERINRLIELLIDYARPVRRNKERIKVSELINDSAYFVQISEMDSRINFQINDLTQGYIYANRDQIKQSLVNLIMNSIQSVDKKLKNTKGGIINQLIISISGYRRNNQLCIEVYDEGYGMTEEETERCMEPFFTTKATGLGMGLALSRQFVYENLGKLEFESDKNEFMIIRIVFEEDLKL